MKKHSIIHRALPGLLAIGFATAQLPAAEATPLAKVGDTEIKVEDVKPLLEKLDARQQAALAKDPALLNQFVRTLLVQQLLVKEAQEGRWDQQPAVKELLDRARDTALAESYLQSVSKVPASYPSDAELQEAYDANKAALLLPKQIRLAQIFVSVPKGADKATVDKAQSRVTSIRESLKQEDFAAVARTSSDEQASAANGGEIGWLTEAQIQPEIRTQVTGLAKGGASEPIRLNDGWHIIKVLEVKEPYTPALAEIKNELAQQLRASRTRANSESYLAKLLQDKQVAINEIALSQLLGKSPK